MKDENTDTVLYPLRRSVLGRFLALPENVTEFSVDDKFFDTIFSIKILIASILLHLRVSPIFTGEDVSRYYTKVHIWEKGFLENEIVTTKHPVLNGMRSYQYSNLLGGEIYNRSNNLLRWSALAGCHAWAKPW